LDMHQRIKYGNKRCEVSPHSLDGDAICYIDSKTGKLFGIWELLGKETVSILDSSMGASQLRERKEQIAILAGMTLPELESTSLSVTNVVHIRRIGEHLTDSTFEIIKTIEKHRVEGKS
jgi:uncharacterized membrane protein